MSSKFHWGAFIEDSRFQSLVIAPAVPPTILNPIMGDLISCDNVGLVNVLVTLDCPAGTKLGRILTAALADVDGTNTVSPLPPDEYAEDAPYFAPPFRGPRPSPNILVPVGSEYHLSDGSPVMFSRMVFGGDLPAFRFAVVNCSASQILVTVSFRKATSATA